MKRFIINILTLCVLAFFLNGTMFAGTGVKAGVNMANLSFSEDTGTDWNSSIGIRLGVFHSFRLGRKLELQPEIYYSIKGAKSTGTFLGEEVSAKVELGYVEVPLLLKFRVFTGRKAGVFIFTGGYGAFNTAAKTVTSFSGDSETEDIKEEIREMDYGLVIGGELEYGLGNAKLILDIRYSVGLANIKKIGFNPYEIKNRAVSFSLGYRF